MLNDLGVTLIEVVICIAIIGIISCAALPALTAGDMFLLQNSSKELLYDMRLVQQTAVSDGCGCMILFDISDNSYRACSGPAGDVMFKKKLPDGIVFDRSGLSAVGYKITFTDSGNASSCTVSLLDSKRGKRKDISIQIATGYIGFSTGGR